MLAAGTIDPETRTFDILGVEETATSISIVNGSLRLAYTSTDGKIVQLVKPLTSSDNINVGDALGLSPVQENGIGGYAQKGTHQQVAKAIANVDWSDTSNLTTKTFTDANGVTRTAVLLPVVLSLN